MRKKSKLVIIAVAVLLTQSCATIFTGSRQKFTIESTPSEAKITITDIDQKEVFTGVTPATVKLKKGAGFFYKNEYLVKLSTDGYEDKIVPIKFGINGWYFGNIIVGGALGMVIVDPATGAMWQSRKSEIIEELKKK
ncbi:PEGA domain-containing protein [Niabella terrae]